MIFLVLFLNNCLSESVRNTNRYTFKNVIEYIVANNEDFIDLELVPLAGNQYSSKDVFVRYYDTYEGKTTEISYLFSSDKAGLHKISAHTSDGFRLDVNIVAIPTDLNITKVYNLNNKKLYNINDNIYEKFIKYKKDGQDFSLSEIESLDNSNLINNHTLEIFVINGYKVGTLSLMTHKFKVNWEFDEDQYSIESERTILIKGSKIDVKVDGNYQLKIETSSENLNNFSIGEHRVFIYVIFNNQKIFVDKMDFLVVPRLFNNFKLHQKIDLGNLTPGEKASYPLASSEAKIYHPNGSFVYIIENEKLEIAPFVFEQGLNRLSIVYSDYEIATLEFNFIERYAPKDPSKWSTVVWSANNCYMNTGFAAFLRVVDLDNAKTRFQKFVKAYLNSLNLGEQGATYHKDQMTQLAFLTQELFRKEFDNCRIANFEARLVGDSAHRDAQEFLNALIDKLNDPANPFSETSFEYSKDYYVDNNRIAGISSDVTNIVLATLNQNKEVNLAELETQINATKGIFEVTEVIEIKDLLTQQVVKPTEEFVKRFAIERESTYALGNKVFLSDGQNHDITVVQKNVNSGKTEVLSYVDINNLSAGSYLVEEIKGFSIEQMEDKAKSEIKIYFKYEDGYYELYSGEVVKEIQEENLQRIKVLKYENNKMLFTRYSVSIKGININVNEKSKIIKYPKKAIISLKRYSKNGNTIQKNNLPVKVNEEVSLGNKNYKLVAYLLHSGNTNSGHYVGYVKVGNEWYVHNMNSLSKTTKLPHQEYSSAIYVTFWELDS